MKYLGINLPRKVQNYLKTTKHCWKKAALNMFLKILCPRIGRLNVVKVAVLPKLICECNAVRVLSLFSRVWLFGTVGTIARQAPLSMGFSRQEYWRRLSFPLSGDHPNPGIKPVSLMSPALAGRFFTTDTTWKPLGFNLLNFFLRTFTSMFMWDIGLLFSCCCCSVALPFLTVCSPMDCSVPGFPVLHYLLEFAQVHVLWVSNAILTISSSAALFAFCLQSFPASESFPITFLIMF